MVTVIKALQRRRVGSLELDVAEGSHGVLVAGYLSLRNSEYRCVGGEGKHYGLAGGRGLQAEG